MPHIVHLPLTAQDFRQHPAIETELRHWLLDSPCGRELLKTQLRRMRPDTHISSLRWQRHLDPGLKMVIDYLDLREWPEPQGVMERLQALRIQFRMLGCILRDCRPPSWNPGKKEAAPGAAPGCDLHAQP